MVRRTVLTVALVAIAAQPALAQARPPRAPKSAKPAKPPKVAATRPSFPPPADSLEAITRRGRAIAERDSIAWLGAAAMTSLSLPPDSIYRLIAHRTDKGTDKGWEVASGRISDDGIDFVVSELSTPGIQATWASTLFDPPEPGTDYFLRAARAIETSIAMFRRPAPRVYVATVVPAEDGPWWLVYLYPAPRQKGSWPRGGDMRFRVSADGRVITESRRLHEAITEYNVRTARPASALLDRQASVAGDTPEDTDVFHVLQRRPAMPELMIAGKYRYRIDVDGSIRLLPNQ